MPPSPEPSPISLASLYQPPLVLSRGDRRTLEFMPGNVQSEMQISRPLRLVLAYVRAMLCFRWFVPRPRHILMVGLGGGSLPKFCHRYLPHSRITVVELRADVIALRQQFCLPPDDLRLRVVHADAADFVAACAATDDAYDAILVDGFDEAGLPPRLVSPKFYADCWRVLADGGVLAANVFSYDPLYQRMLARLQLVFGGAVCRLDRVAGNNHIVFALKAPSVHALRAQRRVERLRRWSLAPLNRLLVWLTIRRLELGWF